MIYRFVTKGELYDPLAEQIESATNFLNEKGTMEIEDEGKSSDNIRYQKNGEFFIVKALNGIAFNHNNF